MAFFFSFSYYFASHPKEVAFGHLWPKSWIPHLAQFVAYGPFVPSFQTREWRFSFLFFFFFFWRGDLRHCTTCDARWKGMVISFPGVKWLTTFFFEQVMGNNTHARNNHKLLLTRHPCSNEKVESHSNAINALCANYTLQCTPQYPTEVRLPLIFIPHDIEILGKVHLTQQSKHWNNKQLETRKVKSANNTVSRVSLSLSLSLSLTLTQQTWRRAWLSSTQAAVS
jgi:hypothetical protein